MVTTLMSSVAQRFRAYAVTIYAGPGLATELPVHPEDNRRAKKASNAA
jgi:hypothetical protein